MKYYTNTFKAEKFATLIKNGRKPTAHKNLWMTLPVEERDALAKAYSAYNNLYDFDKRLTLYRKENKTALWLHSSQD